MSIMCEFDIDVFIDQYVDDYLHEYLPHIIPNAKERNQFTINKKCKFNRSHRWCLAGVNKCFSNS